MSHRLGMTIVHYPRRIAAGVVAVLAGALLLASVSFGAASTGPPRFVCTGQHLIEAFFSTRAQIACEVAPEGLATKWTAYYGSGPAGPWTEVNSEEISESVAVGTGSEPVEIGTPDHELVHNARHGAVFLRGLKPGTSYDARFVAKNADGEAEVVIPFKTLEVEKPEIDENYVTFKPQETSFELNEAVPPTDTAAGFVAKFDANGAEAKYSFEYAPAEVGGGRPSEGSASWKLFTSGATGTVGAVEEYAWGQAGLAGLKPETKYYVRVKASNSVGGVVQK